MSLADQISADLTDAMKARDKVRTSTLRIVRSGITYLRSSPGHGEDVSDAEVADIITREAKKRRESIQTYTDAGRDELAASEQAELDVLTTYLPEQMDEAQIREVVSATITEVGAAGPSDLGRVMGALMPKVKGRADGKLVNVVVKEELGAG